MGFEGMGLEADRLALRQRPEACMAEDEEPGLRVALTSRHLLR